MRIRTIKPEWLDDERLACASPEARVMSIALILLADDHGRGRASPRMLAGRVFPGSANPREDASRAREELCRARFLLVYEVDGQEYYEIRNWAKHQRVDRPSKSQLPECPPETEHFPAENEPPANIREDAPNAREHSRGCVEGSSTDLDLDLDLDLDQEHMSASPPPEPDKPARVSGRGPDVRRVFEAWLDAHVDAPHRGRTKLTADRRRKIEARLREGYPVEQLIAAVRGVRHSPYHMGENETGTRYTDIVTVLKHGSNVEKFEALDRDGPAPVRAGQRRSEGMAPVSPDSQFRVVTEAELDELYGAQNA